MVHIVEIKVLRVYIEASKGQRVGVDLKEEQNSAEPIYKTSRYTGIY